MKKIFLSVSFLLFFLVPGSHAAVNMSLSYNEGKSSFYLSVGEYFNVPHRDVLFVSEMHISDDEIPVVFFLSQKTHIPPARIIDLRIKGMSWQDITLHFGYGPDIFYFPVNQTVVLNPPYGKAYGHFKHRPKKEWKTLRLGDDDIINLVNLKFISQHHKHPPDKIIALRGEGRNFVVIDDDIIKHKKQIREKVREDKHRIKSELKSEKKEIRERHRGKHRKDD